jgi:hypothetical protein
MGLYPHQSLASSLSGLVTTTGAGWAGSPSLPCTIPTEGAPSLRFLQEPALSLPKGWAAMLLIRLLSVLHCPLWMPLLLLHFVSKSVETLSFFQSRASSNRARSFLSAAVYASLPSKSRNGGFRSCVNWTIA